MSLRLRLILALAALLTFVAIGAAWYAFAAATEEAESFLDRQQRQVARYVGDQPFVSAETAGIPTTESEDDYVVAVRYRDGRPLNTSHPEIALPDVGQTGFSTFATQAGDWRLFTLVLPERTIQVAQQEEVRSEIAEDGALNAALPILLSIPLSWLLLVVVTAIAFRPLERTAQSIAKRRPTDTTPIDPDSVPPEVRPLVEAFDALLARLRLALQQQKDFIGEAAHALRTPLAALTLQIDNLRNVSTDPLAQERLDELKAGARRTSDLAHKLLVLARAEAAPSKVFEMARLDTIVTQVVADLSEIAASRGIDLGISWCNPADVLASAHDLRILCEILIDNAIRYSPAGSKVDVSVSREGSGRCYLKVTDSGPGIPEAEIPRVVERFVRGEGAPGEGSGLGLAIASSIANRYGFTLELRNRPELPGLIASVRLYTQAS